MKQSELMVYIRDLNDRGVKAEKMFELCAKRFPNVLKRELMTALEILIESDGQGE